MEDAKLETTYSNAEQATNEELEVDYDERVPEAHGRDVSTLPLSYFYSPYFLGYVAMRTDYIPYVSLIERLGHSLPVALLSWLL